MKETFSSILSSAGFKYSEEYGLWIKKKGFGGNYTVEKILRNLVTIRKNSRSYTGDGDLVWDGFIESKEQFKNLIQDL